VDPLFAFSFLQTFVDILFEYFGTVNAATLKDNFDVVYQLLEETLDAGGYPLTTYPNALREIVLPPSLLSKLLNVAGANLGPTINSNFGMGGPFSSPIPWRKSVVKHTNNEIYFDLVECLRGVVNKWVLSALLILLSLIVILYRHGTPVSTNVWGTIETNAKLSGTPDCSLSFTNTQLMADLAFHPCVRIQRWTRDKVLSFVPPDGKFVLCEYRYVPTTGSVALPLSVKTMVKMDDANGKELHFSLDWLS
jgi:AP-3 complex subunit mu